MMSLRTMLLFLTFNIASVIADKAYEKVTPRTLKDHFKELERLEKNNIDFSHQNMEQVQDKFKGLFSLSCNEKDNVNQALSEIYQAFENQERKIFQNTQEIKVMKKILKHLATLLSDTSEKKADLEIQSVNKVEFKQQEVPQTRMQLENCANKSQSVQTLPQTAHHSFKTKDTIVTSPARPSNENFRNLKNIDNGEYLPEDVPDCQTPPLPSTYCHHYQVLWYYNSKEGRCNRFRNGCEETFRNSYKSERECRDTCVRPGFEESKACFLPRSPGICKGVERKWYFDWKENRCKDFIYKGCLGNQNRFPDQKTCWQQCGSITMQSEVEQDAEGSKSEYTRKQTNNFIDNDLETKVTKHPTDSKAHLPDKVNNQNYKTNKSIQASSAVKENDGHYPEYVLFENRLLPPSNTVKKSDQHIYKQNNYFPSPISVSKYMVNSPEYNPFNQAKSSYFDKTRRTKSGNQKDLERNSIQSTLPNHEYKQKSEKSAQTYDDKERNDGTNYLDKIAISQQRSGHDYDLNFAKLNKKKTNFKGGYRNRKRKSRQYLYLYNDHHKRRSKFSKTQNLRVELHAPKDIDVGDPFKLRCIVSGSLSEAVDIIWDKDDESDDTRGVDWKKKERISKFSNKKTSTLYIPGIYSSVRFTCLVSCYDPQEASLLPAKLREKEKLEQVESYLCAFDSLKLTPNDGF